MLFSIGTTTVQVWDLYSGLELQIFRPVPSVGSAEDHYITALAAGTVHGYQVCIPALHALFQLQQLTACQDKQASHVGACKQASQVGGSERNHVKPGMQTAQLACLLACSNMACLLVLACSQFAFQSPAQCRNIVTVTVTAVIVIVLISTVAIC